jgi:glutamine cyclotransferase
VLQSVTASPHRLAMAAAAALLLLAALLCAILVPVLSRHTSGTPNPTPLSSSTPEAPAKDAQSNEQRLPKLYSYEVVRELPHDPRAFTQGLQFDRHGGREVFWESTGMYGASQVREARSSAL